MKVWFTDSEPPSASHHMSSAWWEANYRKERKTLSGLPPCTDFPRLHSFKTFTWFSRQISHRGECSACQATALFRLDQKIPPPPPGSPSLLLYFLSFCHLPVVFPCCAHFGGFFFFWFCIIVFIMLSLCGPRSWEIELKIIQVCSVLRIKIYLFLEHFSRQNYKVL